MTNSAQGPGHDPDRGPELGHCDSLLGEAPSEMLGSPLALDRRVRRVQRLGVKPG